MYKELPISENNLKYIIEKWTKNKIVNKKNANGSFKKKDAHFNKKKTITSLPTFEISNYQPKKNTVKL